MHERPSPDELTQALALALDTSGKGRAPSGSVALSTSGARYAAGSVASQTHLLDIPSELAALAGAAHACDREIVAVTTMTGSAAGPSPLVLKILADHAARTGVPLAYRLMSPEGTELFATDDARTALPGYTPTVAQLAPSAEKPSAARAKRDPAVPLEEELKRYALLGASRNFPTRDGASGYGAAVLAGDTIYYGGQYSAPDERLGLHAEMAVLVTALMSGVKSVDGIGIASPKFIESPVSPCGVCRQFMVEVCTLLGCAPEVWCFATAGAQHKSTLEGLLPLQWSNNI